MSGGHKLSSEIHKLLTQKQERGFSGWFKYKDNWRRLFDERHKIRLKLQKETHTYVDKTIFNEHLSNYFIGLCKHIYAFTSEKIIPLFTQNYEYKPDVKLLVRTKFLYIPMITCMKKYEPKEKENFRREFEKLKTPNWG